MSPTLLLPLVFAVLATLVGGASQRYFRPSVAAWSLSVSCVVSVIGVASGLVMLLLGYADDERWLGHGEMWCIHQQHHPTVWTPLGAALAVAWLAIVVRRVRRVRSDYVSLAPRVGRTDSFEVVPTPDAMAYTLPGPQGFIVVSQGMLDALSDDERRVLIAHERSHLAHRHDRFIHAVDVAAAVVPVLARMRQAIRYATERWADEDAASNVGDRRLVARALSRAALVQSASLQPGMSLAGLGVRQRVEQMLEEPQRRIALQAALWSTCALTLVALASSSLQVHHLALLSEHLCNWGHSAM